MNIAPLQVKQGFHKAENWVYTRKNAGWPLTDWEADRYKQIFFSSLGVKKSLMDHYDRFLLSSLEKSQFWTTSLRLSEGIIPLLSSLAEKEIKCGLILNSDIEATKALDKFEIRQYFQEIVTPSSTGSGLPDPRILQVAMSSFKSRPSRSLLVGSRPLVEGEGAKAAKIPYVLVVGTEDMFEQPKASLIGYNVIPGFPELLSSLNLG
ncbi:MAG: HAD family hydrolase [Candidatus Heimdallarchaeota archaeon]